MKKNLVAVMAAIVSLGFSGCRPSVPVTAGGVFKPAAVIEGSRDATTGKMTLSLGQVAPTSNGRAVVVIDGGVTGGDLVGGIAVRILDVAATAAAGPRGPDNPQGGNQYVNLIVAEDGSVSFDTGTSTDPKEYLVELVWGLADANGAAANPAHDIPVTVRGETQVFFEINYCPDYDDGVTPLHPSYTITATIDGVAYDVTGGKPEVLTVGGLGAAGLAPWIQAHIYAFRYNPNGLAIFDIGDVLDADGNVK